MFSMQQLLHNTEGFCCRLSQGGYGEDQVSERKEISRGLEEGD